jgi:hypothetical protein
VLGDIQTGEGLIRMYIPPPDDGHPVFEVNADALEDRISMKLGQPPPDDGMPEIEMTADEIGSRLIIDDGMPGDNRAVEISADALGSRLIIEDNMPEGDRAVEIGAGYDDAYLSLLMTTTRVPVLDFRGDVSGTSFEMSGYETGQQIGPLLGMNTDANGANFAMTAPGMGGAGADINYPIIELITDDSGGDININWAEPLDMPSPAIELSVENVLNNITMNWAEPLDMPSPAIEMSTAPTTGATYRMFQPQPEPPGMPFLEMNTYSAGAKFAMTAPGLGGAGSEITDPIIKMITDASGGDININWAEPLDMPSPAIELSVDDVISNITINWAEPLDEEPSPAIAMGCDMAGDASIVMFQPQPEPPGSDPIIEMLTGAGGGNFTMYGQQAGLVSTPFFEISSYSSGADMKFFDSGGETSINMNNSGDVTARRGNFGLNNSNTGMAAFVAGSGNSVSGNNSLAAGKDVVAAHNGSFVWGDANPGPLAPLSTNADNQFMVRSTGGVAFYSSNDLSSGVALGPGASAWSPIIPPGPELNTRPVDGEEILSKIKELPLTYYSHKSEVNGIEHIGPLPEDFNQLFTPSQEDTHVSLQDEAGVALAAVKELINTVEEQNETIRMLERRISELEKR